MACTQHALVSVATRERNESPHGKLHQCQCSKFCNLSLATLADPRNPNAALARLAPSEDEKRTAVDGFNAQALSMSENPPIIPALGFPDAFPPISNCATVLTPASLFLNVVNPGRLFLRVLTELQRDVDHKCLCEVTGPSFQGQGNILCCIAFLFLEALYTPHEILVGLAPGRVFELRDPELLTSTAHAALIVVKNPYSLTFRTQSTQRCFAVGCCAVNDKKEFALCSKCRWATYCSRDHQLADWKQRHKRVCRNVGHCVDVSAALGKLREHMAWCKLRGEISDFEFQQPIGMPTSPPASTPTAVQVQNYQRQEQQHASPIPPISSISSQVELRPSPLAGVGTFAKQDMRAGTLLVVETPLLVAPVTPPQSPAGHRFLDHARLTEAFDYYDTNLQRVLSLHPAGALPASTQLRLHDAQDCSRIVLNVPADSHLRRVAAGQPAVPLPDYIQSSDPNRVLTLDFAFPRAWSLASLVRLTSTFCANTFCYGLDGVSVNHVFQHTSRFNHSCLPNVSCFYFLPWHVRVLFTSRDVKAGDELLMSYFPLGDSRPDFVCACPLCAADLSRLQTYADIPPQLYPLFLSRSDLVKKFDHLNDSLFRIMDLSQVKLKALDHKSMEQYLKLVREKYELLAALYGPSSTRAFTAAMEKILQQRLRGGKNSVRNADIALARSYNERFSFGDPQLMLRSQVL